ncbi:WYL domain-containing protein [Salinibacterium sp. G-O1]|uniref:helix-turn-helix transcriptional regulator n=1 Tax=Salinibacterium sp. G-O1 TaxID=3046208 RepID=UPI0024BA6C4A|nr:WYL domain-containing protein [Salinibacterium sp. G-O1]MDJ0335051.1 WYL domain-containing protein [Salinibacterium sp. G-O1]
MAQAGAGSRIPAEERLFSLVLALLATDAGLTKTDILSTVQGYRQKFSRSGDNANLERQFERDKDDIRDLGVPLETVDSPGHAGDNHNLRYRIPRGAYELPTDIRFSPEETTLLNLAAMVWREGSLSAESRRAILKLRSLGVTTTEPVVGYAPRVRVRESAFDPLGTALERRQVVRFGYLKPGESEAQTRTVEPLALVQHQGRWHLFANDPETSTTRTFLLRRIVTQVATLPATFEPPAPGQADIALTELEAVWNSNTAVVEVEPGTDAATRLEKRRGSSTSAPGTLNLHYSDLNIFADELAGYGPEALVVSPPELRDAVRSRLERTAADHG